MLGEKLPDFSLRVACLLSYAVGRKLRRGELSIRTPPTFSRHVRNEYFEGLSRDYCGHL